MGQVLGCFLWKSMWLAFSEPNVFVLPLHLIGNFPECGILIWNFEGIASWLLGSSVGAEKSEAIPAPESSHGSRFFSGGSWGYSLSSDSVVLGGSSVCLSSQPACQACQLAVPCLWGHFLTLLHSLFLPSILSALSGTTVIQTVPVLVGAVASLLVAVSLPLMAEICFQFSQQGFQVFHFQELFLCSLIFFKYVTTCPI